MWLAAHLRRYKAVPYGAAEGESEARFNAAEMSRIFSGGIAREVTRGQTTGVGLDYLGKECVL